MSIQALEQAVLIVPVMWIGDYLILPEAAHQEKHRHLGWLTLYVLSYVALFNWFITHDTGDLLLIGLARFLIGYFRLPGKWARVINWEWVNAQPVCDRNLMRGMGWAMQAAANYFAVLY